MLRKLPSDQRAYSESEAGTQESHRQSGLGAVAALTQPAGLVRGERTESDAADEPALEPVCRWRGRHEPRDRLRGRREGLEIVGQMLGVCGRRNRSEKHDQEASPKDHRLKLVAGLIFEQLP